MSKLLSAIGEKLSRSGHYEEHPEEVAANLIAIKALEKTASKAESAGAAAIVSTAKGLATKLETIVATRSEARRETGAAAPYVPPEPLRVATGAASRREVASAITEPVRVATGAAAPAVFTELAVKASICPQLYDPCTQAPLPSMAALEKRVRDIKKQADITPVGLYGLTNATTNFDFLMGPFLEKSIALDDLVFFKLHSGGQVGADIFEVLSRMFVFFGGIADVNPQQGGNYHYMEKAEAVAPRVFVDPRQAFQEMKCKASSKYGVSDITLVRTAGAAGGVRISKPYCESDCDIPADGVIKTYLMSVKWYKDEKNAEHYDLEKLKATADKVLTSEQKPYGIIVFLKSKADFDKAHQRASRQYIRHIGNTYFGWEEDVKPFLQDIRRQIFEEAALRHAEPRQIMNERYFIAGAKSSLGLQLHQEIITQSICNTFAASDDNRYLIGVLPRGGKTYIAGGIIREYLRSTEARSMNILWLTAAPTETLSQVREDLILKFQDFAEFEFIYVRDSEVFKKTKPFSFFFCSTQLLTQAKAGIERKNRKYLEELLQKPGELGLVFYDEAHKTATGEKTREEIDNILKEYETVKLPLIFLTATYYNILFEYRILPENTFIWDYTDVLKTRGLASESDQGAAIDNLKERFRNPALVDSILMRRQSNGESISAMGKPYLEFPELYFISADFQTEALERFDRQGAYRPNSGFSMSAIFGTRPEASLASIKTAAGGIRADAYNVFIDIVNARNMISLITPKEDFGDGLEGGVPLTQENPLLEPTLLGRIDALSRTMDSRFRLDHNPTLLMFMPTGGAGSRIYFTLCAWAALLMKHPWWRARYEVACVVDSQSLTPEELIESVGLPDIAEHGIHVLKRDPKAEIMALERRLHCPAVGGPKGLVILAGQKLSMGVSLPCTDVVFLFNDSKSPDDIIQKMYRGLTPSPGKKAAFVVDLNPVRSLAAVYGYTRAANVTANTTTSLLNIIYDTYSWDSDVFDIALSKGAEARPQSFQEKLRQLFDKAASDPEYRIYEDFGGLERRLGTNIRSHLETDFVKSLTAHFTERRGSTGAVIELRDGASAFMKAGKLVIRQPIPAAAGAGASAAGEPSPDVTEIVIDNFIETVSDFVKYLAITSSKATLKEALVEYESMMDFKSNVDQLLYARADMKSVDKTVLGHILVNAVRNFSFTSSEMVFRQMKGVVDDSETRKNAILQVINKRLTPRQKQRKEHGEVFTPLELIKEMLDHLPEDVWANPELKWLDPANGIGNFPVAVFYRLDEGLKAVMPDANARRKHIIENMLYMIELQSSNSRIAKNIFTKLCVGCEPNVLTRDTLKVTPAELAAKGWPAHFDIIMGNPPYQPSQLWEDFILKSLSLSKENGFITLLIPTSWTSPTSKSWKMLHTKNILVVNSALYIKKDYFPRVSSTFSYFLIQNKPSSASTDIYYDKHKHFKHRLGELGFLPKIITPATISINEKVLVNELPGRFIRKDRGGFKKESSGEFVHPYITFVKPSGETDIQYLNLKDPRQDEKKVLLFRNGYINPYYDDSVNGVGDNIHALTVDSAKEGRDIVKLFNSKLYKYIFKVNKHSQYNHGGLMDMVFRDVSRIDSFTDADIFNYFHLSPGEISTVMNVLGEIEEEPAAEGGARRSKYNRTRKVRRI